MILKNAPDVLLLQEVSVSWIPYIHTFMKENGYECYGYGRRGADITDKEFHEREQFTPILWKTEKYDLKKSGHFWLSDTPEVYSTKWTDGTDSKFPRCVNWVILRDKKTGGEFMALCIHTDPESKDVRTKSCRLMAEMAEKIREGLPIIMGGDWNMQPGDDAYRAICEGGFKDMRLIAEKTMLGGSFNAWGARSEDNYAYGDYLFVSDNIEAESYEITEDYYNGVHISDHCPLKTVFCF